jgi:hypothetical protein
MDQNRIFIHISFYNSYMSTTLKKNKEMKFHAFDLEKFGCLNSDDNNMKKDVKK